MPDKPNVSAEPCSSNASLMNSAGPAPLPDDYLLEFLRTFEVNCMAPPRYIGNNDSRMRRFMEYMALKGKSCRAAYENFMEFTPEDDYSFEDIKRTMEEIKYNLPPTITTKNPEKVGGIIGVRGYETYLICEVRMMKNMPLSVRLLLRKVSHKLRELVLATPLHLDTVELELAGKQVNIKAGDCQINYRKTIYGVAISSGSQKSYDEEMDIMEHAGRDLKTILENKNLTVNNLKILEGTWHFNPYHQNQLHSTLGFLDECRDGKPKIKHLSFDYSTLQALTMILNCVNLDFLESIELVDAKRRVYTGLMRRFQWEKMEKFKTFATNMILNFSDVTGGLPHLNVLRCRTNIVVTIELVQEMIDILLGCEPTLQEVYIQTELDDVPFEVYDHFKDLRRNPNVTEYFFTYTNHPECTLVMVLTADSIQFRGPNFDPEKRWKMRERNANKCYCQWSNYRTR
ncbi:hypothetical protein CAEBREN_18336 [Caenorhabditis brenneri]|uniref:DUF38 domain-containing protein n=1 Tax=Caenorhabditis brenneri TaxID=135651 RepID=G0MQL8_CAEBE|nr:hypothetical protein CAEBREN_18336 [Caenorhabditis brenneri]